MKALPNSYPGDVHAVFRVESAVFILKKGIQMRTLQNVLLSSSLLAASAAHAGDWFDNVGASLGRIEPWSDGSLWLSLPASNPNPVTISGHSGSCTVTQTTDPGSMGSRPARRFPRTR